MGVTAAIGSIGLGVAGAINQQRGSSQAQSGAQYAAQSAQQQSTIAAQQAGLQSQYAITQAAGQRDYAIESAQLQSAYATGTAQLSSQFAGQEASLNIQQAQLSAQGAQASAGIQQSIIGLQQQAQAINFQAMNLVARRQQMEQFRIAQRARAQSLATATAGGAQFGTGLFGANAQTQGQTGFNVLGIQQNLELGREMFNVNAGISQQNIAQSQLGAQLAGGFADIQTQKAQQQYEYAKAGAASTTEFYGQQAANISQFSENQYQATAAFSATNAGLQSSMAYLGGQIAVGQGQIAAGQGQMQMGSSYLQAAPSLFNAYSNVNTLFPQVGSFGSQYGLQSLFGGPA